ncbi:hypothetical protein FA95DRAFT_1552262 [Auriscalpium vulgare]|uniref:Uncharacterized protein n=1 Tax=Auriscalpium vulgare TaxID=40419 RepID=A0ACB8SBB4_9AGAM|nr:hypothetical protein FA95DRAFT_1552262 [Auriscalpium vulgare]
MPHKRAKRSVREQQRNERGTDLAPSGSISLEGIPKSLARVLDAAKIRTEYKDKKRKIASGEDDGNTNKRRKKVHEDGKAKDIAIKPGESLRHFNRRVEDDMRPLVRDAMQSSAAVSRKARKDGPTSKTSASTDKKRKEAEADDSDDDAAPSPVSKHDGKAKEFSTLSSSAPRRLNDIAMAPPTLKKPPRGTARIKKAGGGDGRNSGVLSMAQKAMMEVEREKAIQRYREMKGRARASGQGSSDRAGAES